VRLPPRAATATRVTSALVCAMQDLTQSLVSALTSRVSCRSQLREAMPRRPTPTLTAEEFAKYCVPCLRLGIVWSEDV
jgi:hypothetical protein